MGGTKILGVAVDPADPAALLGQVERPTGPGLDALLDTLRFVVDSLLGAPAGDASAIASATAGQGPRRLVGIGIGLPGLVTNAQRLRYGPNLPGVVDADVIGPLAALFGAAAQGDGAPAQGDGAPAQGDDASAQGDGAGARRPSRGPVPRIRVDNDGNCHARAEAALGAGRGADDMLFVGLGTGISCGVVIDGRLRRGVHGFAGEPGHMTVLPGGPRCACGRDGCWEALASGTALAAQARAAARRGEARDLADLVGGAVDELRGEHVAAALAAGSVSAARIVDRFAGWVALGVGNLVNLLDPAVVVLGGSVLGLGDGLVEAVRSRLAASTLGFELRPQLRVEAAKLGRAAGAIGAALLVAAGEQDVGMNAGGGVAPH